MAETAVASECVCETITAEPIQCPTHYRLYRGGRRLASVSSIVRQSFPLDPNIPPDVLENARIRGSELDRLAAVYVRDGRIRIPAGSVREDSKDLFLKFQRWFDAQNFKKVEVQVLLGCEDHGGIVDFRFDGYPVDLKGTSKVEHSHRLQVAGYSLLNGTQGAIVHVTERMKEARLVPLVRDDYGDWDTMLNHWRMLRRRKPMREQESGND